MKKWIFSLSLAAGIIGLAGCGNQGDDSAVVETTAGNVTKQELYEAMKEQIGAQVIQELVLEKVLSNEYDVSDKELDEKLDELKEQLGAQFEMALLQNGFNDEEEFRQSLKVNLLQEKAAMKDIEVTDDEVKEYYDNKKPEREVRHILFEAEEEEKAKEVKTKLDNGEDFAKLAEEHSKDPGSAEQGGMLGFILEEDPSLDEQFKEVAFELKKDEISEPVETAFGWHIIQVTDIAKKEPFDKSKDQYEYELKLSKLDPTLVQNILKDELKKAKIKVKDKDLKDAFDPILEAPDADDTIDLEDDAEEKDEKDKKEKEK